MLPPGLNLNPTTGQISGTVDSGATPGVYNSTFKMCDQGSEGICCQKELSITVGPACCELEDFDGITWGAESSAIIGAGSVSSTAAFNAFSLSSTSIANGINFRSAEVDRKGTMQFTGSCCTGKLVLVVTNPGVHPSANFAGLDGNYYAIIRIGTTLGGSQILQVVDSFTPSVYLSSGEYPFTLPDSGGVPMTIYFSVYSVSAVTPADATTTQTFSGQFFVT